nr:hypothetical protein [Tanacetum cinerariifolium]
MFSYTRLRNNNDHHFTKNKANKITKDPSSSGQKDLLFVKSLADDTKVSIPSVERPWLSEAEGFIFPNHDTGRILPAESQVNTTNPLVAVTDSSATDYDSANESSVCNTPLPLLEKLAGAEPVSGPKTIKLILKSNSTLKAEASKGVTINKPSSAPAKDNNNASDGFCSLCNSRNSCVYDPNPNSFDCPPDSSLPPHPTYETYSCDSYGNDSHFGYDCQPQFPLNYESEPGYIENYNSYPYDSSSFPQQYLCCDNCGAPHETFSCQPMNQNFYNSNSPGFDQSQPSQFPVIHQPPQEMSIQEMEDLKQQYLDEMKSLINSKHHDEIKIDELKGNFNRMNSLITENEHLDTIPESESDEFIKSSVENLVPILMMTSDEVIYEISFKTYSNPLFDLDEEIISSGFNPILNEDLDSTRKNERFDTKSYLLESLLNHDESITLGIDSDDSDSKGDNLFLERLLHDDPIPLSDTLDFSNVV